MLISKNIIFNNLKIYFKLKVMFKKLLYNYRMRKLRKYYIDYTMKQSSNSINAFCYERDDGGLDKVAIRYIENICNYIVKGIQ